jgi:hypothetical protein
LGRRVRRRADRAIGEMLGSTQERLPARYDGDPVHVPAGSLASCAIHKTFDKENNNGK